MPAYRVGRRCLICLCLVYPQTSLPSGQFAHQGQLAGNSPQTGIPAQQNGTLDQRYPEPVITQEHGVYTIFDLHQGEHSFRQQPDGRFRSPNPWSGTLEKTADGQLRWTKTSSEQVLFSGSITTSSMRPGRSDEQGLLSEPPRKIKQQITQRQLNSTTTRAVSNECTPGINTLPDTQAPDNSQRPETAEAPIALAPGTQDTPSESSDTTVPTDTDEAPTTTASSDPSEQCDTQTAGSHTFQPNPYGGSQITLDARPQSCESYFVEYYGTRRGSEIETGLHLHPPYDNMQATLRTFPIIDFVDASTLYVVHSRDLGNRTFNSASRPNALFNQLMNDGEDIQTRFLDVLEEQGSISASELGQTTTLHAEQLRPVTLQLVIRDGIASAEHWTQIALAREQLMQRHGVILEVVIIP